MAKHSSHQHRFLSYALVVWVLLLSPLPCSASSALRGSPSPDEKPPKLFTAKGSTAPPSIALLPELSLFSDSGRDPIAFALLELLALELLVEGNLEVIPLGRTIPLLLGLDQQGVLGSDSAQAAQLVAETLAADIAIVLSSGTCNEGVASVWVSVFQKGKPRVSLPPFAGSCHNTLQLTTRIRQALNRELNLPHAEESPSVGAEDLSEQSLVGLFGTALERIWHADVNNAIVALSTLVDGSPTSPLAHAALGRALRLQGKEDSVSLQHLQRAYELSDGLGTELRLSLEASVRAAEGNSKRAASIYIQLLTTSGSPGHYFPRFAGLLLDLYQPEEGLEILRALSTLSPQIAHSPDLPLRKAEFYYFLDRYDEMEASARKAIAIAEDSYSPSVAADGYLLILESKRWRNDYRQASKAARKAQLIFENLNDEASVANTLERRAEIQLDLGQDRLAHSTYRIALAKYKRASLPHDIARVEAKLASLNERRQRPQWTRRRIDRAYNLARKATDPTGLAAVASLRAVRYHRQGQLPEAQRRYEEARKHYRKAGNRSAYATLTVDLGEISLALGDLRKAASQYLDAESTFLDLLDGAGAAYVAFRRAELHSVQDNAESARQLLQEAVPRAGLAEERIEMELFLADLYFHSGELQKSESLLNRLKLEAKAKSLDQLAGSAGVGIARIHARRGMVAEAERELRSASRILEGTEDITLSSRHWTISAEIHLLTGSRNLIDQDLLKLRNLVQQTRPGARRRNVKIELEARLALAQLKEGLGKQALATREFEAVAAEAEAMGFARLARLAKEALAD